MVRGDLPLKWRKLYGEDLPNAIETLEFSDTEDALGLIKLIEKESRSEFGIVSLEFFSRPDLRESLVNIGNRFEDDDAILENVIRTLGTISQRCTVSLQESQNLSEIYDVKTQNVYAFLFSHKDSTNRIIKRLIAYTITFFPQFNDYDQKWDYIMSIPKIAPKKDSVAEFRGIIKARINEVPNDLRGRIVEVFRDFISNKNLHEYTRKLYTDVIDQLCQANE